jgi:two-component system chemotaxis response regulator CheY
MPEAYMKRTQKTLVVDDDSLLTEILAIMLDSLGMKDAAKALNGPQALEQYEQALRAGSPFSLVLLDILMPGMDGQEVLKRMRAMEEQAGIPRDARSVIIMTTALHSPKDMMDALLDGDCTDYIVKPIDEGSLHGMLLKYEFIQ